MIFTILFISACSHSIDQYRPRYYETGEGESLESVITEILGGEDSEYYHALRSQYLHILPKWNPQVSDWNNIPEDTKLLISSPTTPYVDHY